LKRLDKREFSHITLDLHTNGQLFDARAFTDFELSGRIGRVEISIDAARSETYAFVRRGGEFSRLLKNLAFVRDLRRAGEISELTFSFVVQTRNFREMPAFVRLGEEFAADIVSFQMIRNWGTFSPQEFAEEFIGDPTHPRHPELIEILRDPAFASPIARVGNVLEYVREGAAA
jgi:MoaA/NifB/PqqE/SkfB family radical SAM enzyme